MRFPASSPGRCGTVTTSLGPNASATAFSMAGVAAAGAIPSAQEDMFTLSAVRFRRLSPSTPFSICIRGVDL